MKKLKYDDTFPLLAEGYAREGMTDVQIAEKLDVSVSTFYQYQKKYPLFKQAVKRGKEPVDTKVENALLRKALGHKRRETFIEDMIDKKTGELLDTLKRKVVIKEMAPDTAAAIFWLKNRRPDKFRDKQDVSLSGDLHLHFDKQDEKL